jgi:uncharacterized membrane protein YfcA
MVLAAIAFGLLIGLTMGALGGGGSILTVPALVFALGLTAQEATTGSLVIVGVTAAIACAGHARAGRTRWGQGLTLAAAGVPASLLGTLLNSHVDPDVLLLAFAALMLVAATGMLLRTLDLDDEPPTSGSGGTATAVRTHRLHLVVAGLGIGFLTGFLGVGGGFVLVPVLVVLLGFEMPAAVGTSLLVIALNSGVALAARASHGAFVWSVILPFTAAAVLGSVAGTRVSDRVPADHLTRGFAGLLLAVAAYVGAQALLGLT